MTGLLMTGTIGLERLQVSGLSRVPSPPAIIIAFIMNRHLTNAVLRRIARTMDKYYMPHEKDALTGLSKNCRA